MSDTAQLPPVGEGPSTGLAVAPEQPATGARPVNGRPGRVASVLMVIGGVALLGADIAAGALSTAPRFVLSVAGLALLVVGVSRLCKTLIGPRFDLVFWLAAAWLVLICAAALLAPVLPLGDHNDAASALSEPLYAPVDLFSSHPLGTNGDGLDMLSRSIYGARASLAIALSAVLIGTAVGGAIGIVAGYFQKSVDRAVGMATNSLLAVPPLILLIALASVLKPSLTNVALALSLLTIPGMVRLSRATTLAYAPREFVVAARAMGATRWRIMTRELLPNVMLPIASLAIVMISILIVAEASLSFLGLGVQPPNPTWGNMIAEGQGTVFEQHPNIVLIPGLFLFLTVFAFNIVGEQARRRWDSRSVKL